MTRPRRFANSGQKTVRHLPRWMMPVILIVLCFLAVWLLPPFRLQAVLVPEDMHSLTREDLLTALDIPLGRHLFAELGGSLPLLLGLRYGRAETRLKAQYPVIRDVVVEMAFPGRVEISLSERVEVAWLTVPDGCVMIDKEGVALKINSQAPQGIPVIEGVHVHSMILGQPLTVDVSEALNRAIGLLGAIIEADRDPRPATVLLPRVSSIRPLSGHQLYMVLVIPETGEEITVLTERYPEQAEDMLWLRFALDQAALAGRGKGILDLTGGGRTFIPDA